MGEEISRGGFPRLSIPNRTEHNRECSRSNLALLEARIALALTAMRPTEVTYYVGVWPATSISSFIRCSNVSEL